MFGRTLIYGGRSLKGVRWGGGGGLIWRDGVWGGGGVGTPHYIHQGIRGKLSL